MQRGRLFGDLWRGYAILFALAAAAILLAGVVGQNGLGWILKAPGSERLGVWLLPFLLWIAVVGIAVVRRRSERPTKAILRLLRRDRRWMLRGTLLTVVTYTSAKAFSAAKHAIPAMVPFYADPYFVAADRLIFLGVDPWRITHAAFGPGATVVIDRIYMLWFFAMFILLAWLQFSRDLKFQLQGLLTFYLICFVLGCVAATALSSVGPWNIEYRYGLTDYAPLMARLREVDAEHPLLAFEAMKFLSRTEKALAFGGGISAMPSVHVAVASLLFICTLRLKQSWPAWLSGAFAIAILIGSVHLAWHYAVDGLVSIVGVVLIWKLSGKLVERIAASPSGVCTSGRLSPRARQLEKPN